MTSNNHLLRMSIKLYWQLFNIYFKTTRLAGHSKVFSTGNALRLTYRIWQEHGPSGF